MYFVWYAWCPGDKQGVETRLEMLSYVRCLFYLKFSFNFFPLHGTPRFPFQGQFIQGLSSRLKGEKFSGCFNGPRSTIFMILKLSVIVQLMNGSKELCWKHSCHTENSFVKNLWLGIRSKEIPKEKTVSRGNVRENILEVQFSWGIFFCLLQCF